MTEQETVTVQKAKQVVVVQGRKKRANEWRGTNGDLDTHGTFPLTINYKTSRLTVTMTARVKPINSDKIVEAMKARIVCRDDKGRRVVYRQTPFYNAWQLYDEGAHDLAYEKMSPEVLQKLLDLSKQNHGPLKLSMVAIDGEIHTTIEVDEEVVKRYVRLDDGKEVEFEPPEKTHEITITDEDLRPSTTIDKYLQEGVKAIFAYNLVDIPNMWLVVQDLIKNDQVAIVQSWIERTGSTKEKRLIMKPHYNVETSEFELVGLVCLTDFELPGVMPTPSPGQTAQQEGQKKRVSLLELAGQAKI